MKSTPIPKRVRDEKLRLCPFCAVCHTDKNLELNHIDPSKPATIANLIVLCGKHHGIWHYMSATHRNRDLLRNGIAEAKSRGVHIGRKPAEYERVMRLIAEHSTQFNDIYDPEYDLCTENEIMEMAGVKSGCYYKCKRMLLEAMDAQEWPYTWARPKVRKEMALYDHYIKRIRDDKTGPQNFWVENRIAGGAKACC